MEKIIDIDSHTHINHDVPAESSGDRTPVYSAKLGQLRRVNLAAGIDKMLCSIFPSVTGP